jgi:hypothetical protein
MIAERDEGATAVEACLEVMKTRGPVEVVPHVVGAIPQQLHGHAGALRYRGGLHGIVAGAAPAEAAAAASQMDGDVLRLYLKRARNHRSIAFWVLRRRPDLELAGGVRSSAVLRLERGVREKWIRVVGLEHLRSAG